MKITKRKKEIIIFTLTEFCLGVKFHLINDENALKVCL